MKTTTVLGVAIFFGLTLGTAKVNSQTVAIGHICAEVVESVSAASAVVTDFEIVKNIPTTRASESLNLGEIKLNSGKDMFCNVVLQRASLSDSQGNGFIIEPAVKNELVTSPSKGDGTKTIQLGGTTKLDESLASGQYKGSYSVIFAFN